MDTKGYHLYSKYWTESPKKIIPIPSFKYLEKLKMYYEKKKKKKKKKKQQNNNNNSKIIIIITIIIIMFIIIIIIIVIRCHITSNEWILYNTLIYILSIGEIYKSLQCRPKSIATLHLMNRYCRIYLTCSRLWTDSPYPKQLTILHVINIYYTIPLYPKYWTNSSEQTV